MRMAAKLEADSEKVRTGLLSADALRVAKAFQDATGYHLRHPPLFAPGAP